MSIQRHLIASTVVASVIVAWGSSPAIAGQDAPPLSTCVLGEQTQLEGRTWQCTDVGGQSVLVPREPVAVTGTAVDITRAASGGLWTVVIRITAPSSVRQCRVSIRQGAERASALARLTSGVATVANRLRKSPTAMVIVTAKCGVSTGVGQVRLNRDGSLVTRADCIDVWHDQQYANVVPGYGSRLDPARLRALADSCSAFPPLTNEEKNAATQEMFNQVGLIAEREVRRVSAERGIPICSAINAVFKPVGLSGQLVMNPDYTTNAVGPVAGYATDSYFPILQQQWTDGPFRMKIAVGCNPSDPDTIRTGQSLWLIMQHWTPPVFAGQVYPPADLSKAPASQPWNSTASTCIVWGSGIGNDGIGGHGKVFGFPWDRTSMPNDVRDCQARYLHEGMYAQITDDYLTNLP